MVKVYYLSSTLPECQRAVLSNITFTIFAVLNVFKLPSFLHLYLLFFLLYV